MPNTSRAAASMLAAAHDKDQAAQSRAGDRRAFSELVRRYGSAVRGLLRRIGAAPSLADRVARDAFLDAFDRIAEFRGEVAFQVWVKQIAVRRYARVWRNPSRSATPPVNTASPRPGESASTTPWLDRALGDLTDVERVCIGICYGGGLSQAEAAKALNLPLASVKSHLKRGLDGLRARLGDREHSGVDG